MTWRLVDAGETLFDQINDRWPRRDKASDGSVGDTAHQARPSDHNPRHGVVHAIDIDKDLRGSENDNHWLADQLIAYPRMHRAGSGRLLNVVWWDRVASGTYNSQFWTWRGRGYDHYTHIHVSFTEAADDNGAKFDLPIFSGKRGVWDGVVPFYDLLRKSISDKKATKATWRLACRLKELGFYEGDVLPEGEQAYPQKAVSAMQDWMGWEVKPYNSKTHMSIWRELKNSTS